MSTSPEMTCGFSDTTGILQKKTMWFIGVEVEQETSAPRPKINPGSAPESGSNWIISRKLPPTPPLRQHFALHVSEK